MKRRGRAAEGDGPVQFTLRSSTISLRSLKLNLRLSNIKLRLFKLTLRSPKAGTCRPLPCHPPRRMSRRADVEESAIPGRIRAELLASLPYISSPIPQMNVAATATLGGPYSFTCFNGAALSCSTLGINSDVNANTTNFTGFAVNTTMLFVRNDATLNLSGGSQLNTTSLALFASDTAAPRPTVNINDGTLRLGSSGSISMGQIALNPSGNLDMAANSALTVRLIGGLDL